MRTYFFGALLGQRDSLKYDRELFYLGAVLHDLGLTEEFSGQQRFEVDGADVARAFVIEHESCRVIRSKILETQP